MRPEMTRNQGENCQKWGQKWGSNWSALSRLNVDSLYTLGKQAKGGGTGLFENVVTLSMVNATIFGPKI